MIVQESGGTSLTKFLKGMHVLAVDDDLTCLTMLEALLKKCQYHVTTTTHARTALNMLREKQDRFDLIITDVHMPDMDGFKLLEIVGLEMDLPVIMLSANSDSQMVMKGILHGACDYMVKPVRIEELRNIWQHVVRNKKVDSNSRNKSHSSDRYHQGSKGGKGKVETGNSDRNRKLGRKRKDEEDEGEENENDADYLSTKKKSRVVWSKDLHGNFVAAVNQLGIQKAVPKKILHLMNVEGLTRKNVASHLQKYHKSLKKTCSIASQEAYIAAALRGDDDSYIHKGTPDGRGDYGTLSGLVRLPSTKNACQLPIFSSNQLPSSESFNNAQMPPNNMIYTNSSSRNHIQNSPIHLVLNTKFSAPIDDLRGESQSVLVDSNIVDNLSQASNGGLVHNINDPLDDLVNALKKQGDNETMLMDLGEEFDLDALDFGPFM